MSWKNRQRINIAAVVAVMLLYAAILYAQAPTRKRARFVVGDEVTATVGCLPGVGCYGEKFTVVEVGEDGWILVRYEKGAQWWLNPSVMYGILISPVGGLVAEAR